MQMRDVVVNGGLIHRIRRSIALVPGSRRRFVAAILLRLVVTATLVVQAVIVGIMLGRVLAGSGVAGAEELVALVVASLVVRLVAMRSLGPAEARIRGQVEGAVRSRLVEHLLVLGPGPLGGQRTGVIQTAMLEGVGGIGFLLGSFTPLVVSALVSVFAIVLAIVVLDPIVGAIVAACTVLVPFAPVVAERAFGETGRRFWERFGGVASDYLDALQGMATLKAFNAQDRWAEQLRDRSEDLSKDAVALSAMANMFIGFVSLGIAVGTTISVAMGAMRFVRGALSATELLVLLFLVRECFRPLRELQAAIHPAALASSASELVTAVLAQASDVREPTADLVRPPPQGSTIAFEKVSFTYPEASRPALDDVSFSVADGETIAIVGHSGAGKTTVVSLLMRFFDPSHGAIRIEGRDIQELRIEDLRRLIALVPQDTYLFHRTVRDNLLMARPTATDEEVEAAARAAHAHGFIQELPAGYDTLVGERGATLSGGQRQRLAIARALLKDAPILVLDEATSSVDAESERLIQEALGRLAKDRTTLVIAHRLSTIRSTDRVVVLDEGHVVEEGEPERLLTRGGAYARLVSVEGGVT